MVRVLTMPKAVRLESEKISTLGGLFAVGKLGPAFDIKKRHKFRDEDQRLGNARPFTQRAPSTWRGDGCIPCERSRLHWKQC